jgi:hypothetical protein
MKTINAFRFASLFAALATAGLGTTQAHATTGSLDFGGGQVVTSPKIVMVYVGNWDSSTKSLNAQAEVERAYTSIGGTKYFGTLAGYHDGSGNYFQNKPIPIIQRLYDPDTTNPMSAARVNAWLAPYVKAADAQTVFIQVPYAGILTSCGGNNGCRGNFYTPAAPYYVPTGIIPAFDSGGTLRPDFAGGEWIHELVEASLDSMGNGWFVVQDGTSSWDIGDVCDYPNSPWFAGTIPMRTTWANDPFTNDAYATTEFNSSAMSFCSHTYMSVGHLFGVGQFPYHLYHQHLNVGTSIANSAWTDWGTLGASGFLSGGPAVASWGVGRVDVWNWDQSATLRHGYVEAGNSACPSENGTPCFDSWGGAPSGATLMAEPTAASPGMGRYDLFATGTVGGNKVLFGRTWDSGVDTGWQNHGNPGVQIASSPATSAPVSGTSDTFVVGADNNVYRGHWDGSSFTWSKWVGPQTYNGTAMTWQGKPAVASWLPGRFDVMLIDTQGRLFDCGGDNNTAWGNCFIWTPPAGITFNASPAITAEGDQRLVVAARGSDGQGWMKEWNAGQDTGNWVATGGALAGAQVGLGAW